MRRPGSCCFRSLQLGAKYCPDTVVERHEIVMGTDVSETEHGWLMLADTYGCFHHVSPIRDGHFLPFFSGLSGHETCWEMMAERSNP